MEQQSWFIVMRAFNKWGQLTTAVLIDDNYRKGCWC